MSVNEEKLFCVMCSAEVPVERRKKRSITCSDECKKARTKYLHRRAERTRCRYCAQPCTPEEIARFKAWRKWERQPLLHPRKRGMNYFNDPEQQRIARLLTLLA